MEFGFGPVRPGSSSSQGGAVKKHQLEMIHFGKERDLQCAVNVQSEGGSPQLLISPEWDVPFLAINTGWFFWARIS